MQLATFEGEKTIETLVQRLYDIRGRGSNERIQKAARSLLDANPKLKKISEMSKGEMLVVSPGPPISSAATIQPLARTASAMIEAVQGQLDRLAIGLDEKSTKQTEEAKRTLDLSRSETISKLARTEPLLKKQLPEIRKAVTTRLADLEKRKIERKKAFASLRKEFEALVREEK